MFITRSAAGVWRHMAWLIALACALELVFTLSPEASMVAGLLSGLAALPQYLFGVLPIIAGISIALAAEPSRQAHARRDATLLILVTIAFMLVLDPISVGGGAAAPRVP